MLTYANMNMKRTGQDYGARSRLKLMLNKLKKMKGSTLIYSPLGTQFKEASKEASICASSQNDF